MNHPHPGQDDHNGFDADDEFALDAPDPWRAPQALGRDVDSDPFARLDQALDPFADAAPSYGAPSVAGNPVGDLQASAQAALGESNVPRISIQIFCERPSG